MGLFSKITQDYCKYVTVADSVSEATYEVLKKQMNLSETPSRNGNTKELSPHTVVINKPNPYTILSKRGNNPFSTIAETLWVSAGRNDLKDLNEKWLPRSYEYSDDWDDYSKTGTWRAGYGPRLRKYQCRDGSVLDQLELCIQRLKNNPETRQALMTISNPDEDKISKSKDYPCNLIVHFLVRNGQLNTHVYLRSNDIIFGFCINTFEWMFISKYVADQLGIKVGTYHHTASSLHLYEHHYDKAINIIDNYIPVPYFDRVPTTGLEMVTPKEFTDLCNEAFNSGGLSIIHKNSPEILLNFSKALYSNNAIVSGDLDVYVNLVTDITDHNLVLQLLEYGQRRFKRAIWDNKALDKIPPSIRIQMIDVLKKFESKMK